MIVGIDFGTTNMRVAAFVDGKPTIIENHEGDGTTPSVVSFRPDGKVLVGAAAQRDAVRIPENVVRTAKRLIGRRFHEPLTTLLRSTLPVAIVASPDSEPLIEISGDRYSPQQICAKLFGALRTMASERLGCDVNQAVVAVPAYFGDRERRAIHSAALLAGLTPVRMISEPTAAAVFHCFNDDTLKDDTLKTVAIYDLGGGTFDFSVLQFGDGVAEVLATGGDTFLGGEDFDFRIIASILEKHALRLDELGPLARERLKTAAEQAKVELSGSDEADIIVDRLRLQDGRELDVRFVITRQMLQSICQDLIDRTLAICRSAIDDVSRTADYRADFSIDDIDQVILVGGATRLSFVEDSVARLFGKRPIATSRREDAVALGCAVQAAVLDGALRDILLLDVLPHSLGVRFGGQTIVMLDRHSTIPCYGDVTWSEESDQPQDFIFEIFEGEAEHGEDVRILGRADLSAAGARNGWTSIAVRLDVDTNGRIELSLRDPKGKTVYEKRFPGSDTVTVGAGAEPWIVDDSVPDAEYRVVEPERGTHSRRILAVATEWRSGAGGLSTFNRSLCLALSTAGHDVRCLVIDPQPYDVSAAKKGGVELVPVVRPPGFSDQLALARKPKLPDNWWPDIIIGHGRVTGPMAHCLAEDHFPYARRLHIIHMAPDEIEWHKPDRADDAGARAAERTRIECDLAQLASSTAAVGPHLHARCLRDLHPYGVKPLRLDPGFDNDEVTPLGPPPGGPLEILVAGRAEDASLKGLDIAAAACGDLAKCRVGSAAIELVVRGAPKGQAESLRTDLLTSSGYKGTKIVVRHYDSGGDQLSADFHRASVVLMPSRAEGFGLIGQEAIVAGVPLLASAESGLAVLLKERLTREDWTHLIVPITNDMAVDRIAWGEAIAAILDDRDAAFARAARVRDQLAQECSWKMSVESLVAAL